MKEGNQAYYDSDNDKKILMYWDAHGPIALGD